VNLITLDVRTRNEWRQWLARHHASSPGIWLVRHKHHTGVKTMPYEDVVSEALCFGWIDSLVKRLNADRYAIKVTPRKPTSKWSDVNRKRWKGLEAAGRLAAPGRAAAPTVNRYAPKPAIPQLPAYIANAFKRTRPAGDTFRRSRRPTGATSSRGFTPPSDQRRARSGFASRSRCSRPARSSG
jgi:hypothetical protein